jgi:hypothetical protein
MSEERPRLNFGPPQSYEEAILRIPHGRYYTEAMFDFKTLLVSAVLDRKPLKRRMIQVSAESVTSMEKLSFRRNIDSARKTPWSHYLPFYRVEPLKSVFGADERERELTVWTLRPQKPEADKFIMVCVKAEPGFLIDSPDYFLGFLSTEEYDILFPPSFYRPTEKSIG